MPHSNFSDDHRLLYLGHIQMGTCSLPGWTEILVVSSEIVHKQQLPSFPSSRDAKQHGPPLVSTSDHVKSLPTVSALTLPTL